MPFFFKNFFKSWYFFLVSITILLNYLYIILSRSVSSALTVKVFALIFLIQYKYFGSFVASNFACILSIFLSCCFSKIFCWSIKICFFISSTSWFDTLLKVELIFFWIGIFLSNKTVCKTFSLKVPYNSFCRHK